MLSCGDIEGAVEHLGNAVAVCGQPAQLLQVLQKTLPPQIFHLSTSKYYSVVAQSIIYPVWIFGWWLVPLNHRKTSRMRVETMMRAHQT